MSRPLWFVVAVALVVPGCAATTARAHEISTWVPPAVRSMPVTGDALAVRVYPTVAPANSDAWVNVRVERDRRAVSLEIAWLSDDGSGGSHLITLDGDRAAIRHQYPIHGLLAGDYQVTAVLTFDDGTRVQRTAHLIVGGLR